MIATFMPKPFTHLTGQRLPLPHVALGRTTTNLFLDESDPRGLGLSEHGLPLHRRPQDARARLQRAHRADRQLVQAPQGRARPRAAPPGRRSGSRTATTTARRCCASRGRAGSRTARSTARATRTSRPPRCSPPASTGSRTGSTPASRTRRTSTRIPYEELTARGLETLPANLLEATRELERDDVLRAALGRGARRGLRRLLHPREARRVVPLPRAGHAVGDPRVPDALLSRMEKASISRVEFGEKQCSAASPMCRF